MILNFNEKVTVNDILNNDLIVANITKEEVRNKRFKNINGVINKFKQCGKKARSKLIILFGYDDVAEDIYEIGEIREWMAELIKTHPYLFYYVDYNTQNLQILTACIADVTMIKEGRSLTTEEIIANQLQGKTIPNVVMRITLKPETCKLLFDEIIRYGQKVKDSDQNIKEILDNIPSLVRGYLSLLEKG